MSSNTASQQDHHYTVHPNDIQAGDHARQRRPTRFYDYYFRFIQAAAIASSFITMNAAWMAYRASFDCSNVLNFAIASCFVGLRAAGPNGNGSSNTLIHAVITSCKNGMFFFLQFMVLGAIQAQWRSFWFSKATYSD